MTNFKDHIKSFTVLAGAVGICLTALAVFATDDDLSELRVEVRYLEKTQEIRFTQDDILFIKKLIFSTKQELKEDPTDEDKQEQLFDLETQLDKKIKELELIKKK